MDLSQEDKSITEALKKIQKICENAANCLDCPFSNNKNGQCHFDADFPSEWDFVEKEEKVYRYFKDE